MTRRDCRRGRWLGSGRLPIAGDSGSTLPLIIGFTTIALVFIVLAVQVTDIYLAGSRLRSLADSAVLAAAESYEPGESSRPGVVFTDAGVRAAAGRFVERSFADSRYSRLRVDGSSPDGRSVEVTVTARYRPVLVSAFVPKGIALSAHARSRGGLRD